MTDLQDEKKSICSVCKDMGRKSYKADSECRFCGKSFCDEHIAPRKLIKKFRNEKLIDNFQPFSGHACAEYEEGTSIKLKPETISGYDPDIIWNYVNGVPIPVGRKSEIGLVSGSSHESKEHEENRSEDNEEKIISHKASINRHHAAKLKALWYDFGITPKSFIKYALIFLILLTVANLYFTGTFDIVSIILRSIGFTLLYYAILFLHDKTKYHVPWKWLIIAALVILIAYLYKTENFSVLKPIDQLIGIENFTGRILSSFSNFTQGLNQSSVANSVSNIQNTVESKPKIDTSTLELQIHNLINQQRESNGLTDLNFDSKLASIARGHSQDMATRNYFSHTDPEGHDPTYRYTQAGYYCHIDLPNGYYIEGGSENIFQNNLYSEINYVNGIPFYNWNSQDTIASSTVNGWMNSPGHRANILTSYFKNEGIGIAIASDDKVYITENFC